MLAACELQSRQCCLCYCQRMLWQVYARCEFCAFFKTLLAGLLQTCTYFSCMSFELGTVIWRERATDGFEGLLLQLHRQAQTSKTICGTSVWIVIFGEITKQRFSWPEGLHHKISPCNAGICKANVRHAFFVCASCTTQMKNSWHPFSRLLLQMQCYDFIQVLWLHSKCSS